MFGKLMAQYGRAARTQVRRARRGLHARGAGGPARLRALRPRDAGGKGACGDLGDAVAAGVGWVRFEAAVARAEALSAPEVLDPTADLVARHASVKQFGPALLSALAFEGSARSRT